jgi:hypothetical protein
MRGRNGLTAVVVLLALALGACQSDGPTGSAGPSSGSTSAGDAGKERSDLDPCAMATTSEVAATLTQPAGERREKGGAGSKQCEWDSQSGDRYLVLQVLILLPAPKPGTTEGYGWTRAAFDEHWSPGAQPLAGVGDAAYQLPEKGAGTVFVLDGDLAFSVAVVFYRNADAPGHDVIVSSLKPLATGIAGRY